MERYRAAEHYKIAGALLVCMLAIGGILAFFTIGSFSDVLVFRSGCYADLGKEPLGPDAGKVPTLAPPRSTAQSTADKQVHNPLLGQPVYVRVETNHAEIEVGWAHSELLGR